METAESLQEQPKTPLLRSTHGRTRQPIAQILSRAGTFRVVQGCTKGASLKGRHFNDGFRDTDKEWHPHPS